MSSSALVYPVTIKRRDTVATTAMTYHNDTNRRLSGSQLTEPISLHAYQIHIAYLYQQAYESQNQRHKEMKLNNEFIKVITKPFHTRKKQNSGCMS
jgi:hypothetical protein